MGLHVEKRFLKAKMNEWKLFFVYDLGIGTIFFISDETRINCNDCIVNF